MKFHTYEEFKKDFDMNSAIKLGEGSFGTVMKAKCRKSINDLNSTEFALKFVETTSQESFNQAIEELKFSNIIVDHPNVVIIHKVYAWQYPSEQKFVVVFVMEVAVGNLHSELSKRRKANSQFSVFMKENEINAIMSQCLRTFHHLAKNKKIFHRDIKPENILIFNLNPLQIKIADFGMSKQAIGMNMMNTIAGTPIFFSPLLYIAFVNGQHGRIQHDLEKSDVFAMGLTFLQLILNLSDQDLMNCNDPRFKSKNGVQIDGTIDPVYLKQSAGHIKCLEYLKNINNKNIQRCLKGMLDFDERQRFTWQQAIDSLIDQQQNYQIQQSQLKEINVELVQQTQQVFTHPNSKLQIIYQRLISDINSIRNIILIDDDKLLVLTDADIQVVNQQGQSATLSKKRFDIVCYLPGDQTRQFDAKLIGITNGTLAMINLQNSQISFLKSVLITSAITKIFHLRNHIVMAIESNLLRGVDVSKGNIEVVQEYKEHNAQISDALFDESSRLLISCDEGKILICRSLQDNQRLFKYSSISASITTQSTLNNICMGESQQFFASSSVVPEIYLFLIQRGVSFSIQLSKRIVDLQLVPKNLIYVNKILVNITGQEAYCINMSNPDEKLICSLPYKIENAIPFQKNAILIATREQIHLVTLSHKVGKNQRAKNPRTKSCYQGCQVF